MNYGFVSCIPVIVLFIGIFATKRVTESFVAASLIAAILVYKESFLSGYVEMLYAALANPSFQLLVIVAVGFSGLIALFERTGALLGFKKTLVRFCRGPRSTMVFTWVLGGLIFIDDYLNALAVSSSMKELADEYRIPREHLAYTVNCMGACVCVLIPVSSWAAFASGSLSDYGLSHDTYYRAIPFMFYPLCAVIICLLLALRKLPLLGGMKKAYQRMAAGGDSLAPQDSQHSFITIETESDIEPSSPANFIIPILALIGSMLIFNDDIIPGIIIALVLILIMGIVQKRLTVKTFTETFLKGATSMSGLLFNITIAFAMQSANEQMGFSSYIINAFTHNLQPAFLPAITFLIVALTAFVAASFWALIIITFPIFISLAQGVGIDPALVIAAIMSGVALGSQACVYSDAVFMVAAGTGVSNTNQLQSIFPYVLIGAGAATLLFLIAGLLVYCINDI